MSITAAGIVIKVLANGLVFLGLRTPDLSTVSLQLFYKVGSKHEQSGERGLAHLLEHMIFKGTKEHPEGYINKVAQTFSASLNADTSYDRTRYFFNAPKEHWRPFLNILADCMNNCTFLQECLNSEMKAVIQELKMYKDHHVIMLRQEMMSSIFYDHPYHYPIIGFKQDLWNITRQRLMNFYKKHYIPNNAVLVVVGDVDMDQVYASVEEQFGSIPSHPEYVQEERYHSADIAQRSVDLHRDVKQPTFIYCFELSKPDIAEDMAVAVLNNIMCANKTGRLYKKLVEELLMASAVQCSYHDLYDQSLLYIVVTPTPGQHPKEIQHTIQQEIIATLQEVAAGGLTEQEVQRFVPILRSSLLDDMQSPYRLATLIGEGFLKAANPHYLFDILDYPLDNISQQVQEFVKHFCRASVMHTGCLLPLPSQELPYWQQIQEDSDKEDTKVLSAVTRELQKTKEDKKEIIIDIPSPVNFTLPKITTTQLDNAITLFECNKTTIPKIIVAIDCKASSWYEPQGKEGLSLFLAKILLEGTNKYPGSSFIEYLSSRGMDISISPYTISLTMLKEDFKEGLSLLNELCTHATLPETSLERIRTKLQTGVRNFWDSPSSIASTLANKELYAGTPFEHNRVGSEESIASINLEDIKKAYKEFIVPGKARIVVVGDIEGYEVHKEVQEAFAAWKGGAPQQPDIGPIAIPIVSKDITHNLNRDQIVLAICTPSVTTHDSSYGDLLLFDQILGGGLLGSMNNRLFALREQSGLFYTINGALVQRSGKYTGMMYVATIVSKDRLEEARDAINNVLDPKNMTISSDELKKATNAVLRFCTKGFDTLEGAARQILLFDEFGLEHIEQKINDLKTISPEQVIDQVTTIFSQPRTTILVGRV